MPPASPQLVGAGKWIRKENTGQGEEGTWGPGSPPPLRMLIGTQTLSEAAAETGVRGSGFTKWDVNKSCVPQFPQGSCLTL